MPVVTCFSKFDTQSMTGYIVSDCTVSILKTICISKCALQSTEGFAAVIWSWICARRLSALNPPSCTGLDSSIVTECFPKYWILTCCLTHLNVCKACLNVPGKVSLPVPSPSPSLLVLGRCCWDYSSHWTHSLGWAFTSYGSLMMNKTVIICTNKICSYTFAAYRLFTHWMSNK